MLSLDMVKVWGMRKEKKGQKEEVITADPRPTVEVRTDSSCSEAVVQVTLYTKK